MSILILLCIGLVAILHIYFLVLEMFLWTKPLGRKVFRQSPERAEATAVLAANQGLYNGFLAGGLLWALFLNLQNNFQLGRPIAIYFLGCVILAGAYGAYSVNKKILFVQALPAAVALAFVLIS
ncbi:MAG: DUF1304 domain-containing protein [Bacteriovoracia bacterium]